MDWEEKAAALNALSQISVRTRGPNDWYVSQNVEVSEGALLASRRGNGRTPEEAIDDHWKKLTILGPGEYIVIGVGSKRRRAVKWNGYMWETVQEKTRPTD